jgi:hypothetical protein
MAPRVISVAAEDVDCIAPAMSNATSKDLDNRTFMYSTFAMIALSEYQFATTPHDNPDLYQLNIRSGIKYRCLLKY